MLHLFRQFTGIIKHKQAFSVDVIEKPLSVSEVNIFSEPDAKRTNSGIEVDIKKVSARHDLLKNRKP